MKICPTCNTELDDNAVFCHNCGAKQDQENQANQGAAPNGYSQNYYNPQPPKSDPYDHTREFDAQDISDNKVISMLVYLMGVMGVVIAMLGSRESRYVAFHVRQSLKITVLMILLGIAAMVLCWTVVVPFAAGICALILLVVKVICFFQVCSGKAVEPYLIRNFSFLK